MDAETRSGSMAKERNMQASIFYPLRGQVRVGGGDVCMHRPVQMVLLVCRGTHPTGVSVAQRPLVRRRAGPDYCSRPGAS
jgi:hypothetical protein